ncbi:MAG TPA: hypothetical protein VGB57_03295 [Allosphingosinicella sp.]|jgi:hypothetical protein
MGDEQTYEPGGQTYEAGERPDEELAREISPENDADLHADPDAPSGEAGPATEAARPWRVAKALLRLREQVNALAPNRSKVSDGTIGDTNHQNSNSDHNPHVADAGVGVVTAMDITHNPPGGCDSAKIAQSLVASRDPRIKYIIWNRNIVASYPAGGRPAWTWRPYGGRNPHDHHVHISVLGAKAQFDSQSDWAVQVR